MNWLKNWLQDFPTHPATVFVGLIVFLITGITIAVKLALGQKFPDGYDVWIGALIATIGITTAGGIGKRMTDIGYVQAKNTGPPPPTHVTVEAPSKVEVTPP